MQSVTIGSNQASQRLDKFLHKYLPCAGSGFLYKMLRKKNITLNGRKAEGSEILATGDQVCFFFSDETFSKFAGRSLPPILEYQKAYEDLKGIHVLYEDEDILALDKPVGVLSQKADPADQSLNEWMIGYLLERNPAFREELVSFHPSICNRLDRNTSGIVLCGKSLAGTQHLSRQIREHRIRKIYRTICVGEVTKPGQIEGYLEKDTDKNKVKVAGTNQRQESAGFQPAGAPLSYIQTVYTPLCFKNGYTLLEVELITGKTHQIRAHLAWMGNPLIGDFKYGNPEVNRKFQKEYGLENQLLHACRVEFDDKCISAPCPELFAQVQEGLGLKVPKL